MLIVYDQFPSRDYICDISDHWSIKEIIYLFNWKMIKFSCMLDSVHSIHARYIYSPTVWLILMVQDVNVCKYTIHDMNCLPWSTWWWCFFLGYIYIDHMMILRRILIGNRFIWGMEHGWRGTSGWGKSRGVQKIMAPGIWLVKNWLFFKIRVPCGWFLRAFFFGGGWMNYYPVMGGIMNYILSTIIRIPVFFLVSGRGVSYNIGTSPTEAEENDLVVELERSVSEALRQAWEFSWEKYGKPMVQVLDNLRLFLGIVFGNGQDVQRHFVVFWRVFCGWFQLKEFKV